MSSGMSVNTDSGELTKELAESVPLRVFDLVAEERCGHLVGFVTNYEVPIGIQQLRLHLFVPAQLIEAAYRHRILGEPVPSACRFKFVVRQDFEGQLKSLVEFILPLLGKIAGTHDQTSMQVTANQ
jgi:hypothetical protein